jgi:hypothetical protein
MEISSVWHGDDLFVLNMLTSKLVNHYKSQGYSCLVELKCEPCGKDWDAGSTENIAPDYTSWPWFDAANDASQEFLGLFITKVDGFKNSTFSRNIVETIGGSYAEKCRSNNRELVVSGLMFGLSARGLDYGRSWLGSRLWEQSCSCDSSHSFKFRLFCDDRPNFGVVELRDVVVTDGPKFDVFESRRNCCDVISRFEFTLTALDPHVYDSVNECVVDSGFDTESFDCVEWACDESVHVCLPDCCVCDEQNIFVFDSLVSEFCCYCRPLVSSSFCRMVEGVGVGFDTGFVLDVFSGESVLENFSVSFVDECVGGGGCGVDRGQANVFSVLEFNRVPVGVRLRLDWRSKRLLVDCGDGRGFVEGVVSDWVSLGGGLPFGWWFASGSVGVVFEADFGSVGVDARVGLCVFRRRVV